MRNIAIGILWLTLGVFFVACGGASTTAQTLVPATGENNIPPTTTPLPTSTPEPESGSTSVPEPTPTSKPTSEPAPTPVPILAPTLTPVPTATRTPEPTPTPEPTSIPTQTPTSTPVPTPTPTPPPTATPRPPIRFTLSGKVFIPLSYDGLSGVTVAAVARGLVTITDPNGEWSFSGLSAGNVTVNFSAPGREPETRSVMVNSNTVMDRVALGNVWPEQIISAMASLRVPSGLLFKDASGEPGLSYYRWGVAVLRDPAPSSGSIGALAHEYCHAHQDWVVNGDSFGRRAFFDKWFNTAEGLAFKEAALADDAIGARWGPYPNLVEDAAQTCATGLDPGGFLQDDFLERVVPNRARWFQECLLGGNC